MTEKLGVPKEQIVTKKMLKAWRLEADKISNLCAVPGSIRKSGLTFYAYKGTNAEGKSPSRNGTSAIKYEVGKYFSVKSWNINPREDCGKGLHVATRHWIDHELPDTAWCEREEIRVFLVSFRAKDIVCIPHATKYYDAKFRVKRLKVEKEVGGVKDRR